MRQATVSALIEREIEGIGREIRCLDVAINRYERMIANLGTMATLEGLYNRRASHFGQLGSAYRAAIDAEHAGR